MKKKMYTKGKKISLISGTGTFLEFSITAVMLTFVLLIIISIFMKRYAIENFDLYTNQIARDIVVCESLDEAQKLAQKEADEFFSRTNNIDRDSIIIEVEYTVGSPEEWKKGNYITVDIRGKICSLGMFISNDYSSSIIMMIEKDG